MLSAVLLVAGAGLSRRSALGVASRRLDALDHRHCCAATSSPAPGLRRCGRWLLLRAPMRGRQRASSPGNAASASASALIVALMVRLARRIHSFCSSSVRSGQAFASPVVSIECPACSLRAIPFIALRSRFASASVILHSTYPTTGPTSQLTTHHNSRSPVNTLAHLGSPPCPNLGFDLRPHPPVREAH